eukprot:TRINITY_DN82270_c0_g1_i1.p1 TRINITY_DN82270_c0_g1~~TRINITY_DN82270_c0_g1_i1.p1  ORF type:complete len:104 (+),score=25.39 TRINITY_DN82270_c0_g1_i1:124-435(+)
MGRRRSRAMQAPKPKPKLDTTFDCLFCQSAKAVEVKLVRLEQIAYLKCRVCGANFQSRINYLSEAVDVYSDWVDEAEEANMRPPDDSQKEKMAQDKAKLGKAI